MTGDECGAPARWTAANVVTGSRLLVAAPAMLVCAALEARGVFLWIVALSFLSDGLDGILARFSGGPTRFGARLDSWADAAAYSSIAVAVPVMWPTLCRQEWPSFVALVASFSVPGLVGLLKFGRFTSYHTVLVKAAVAATAPALLAVLGWGVTWPLRAAAVVALIAAAEEIAITATLDAPRSNVRSWLSVRRAS